MEKDLTVKVFSQIVKIGLKQGVVVDLACSLLNCPRPFIYSCRVVYIVIPYLSPPADTGCSRPRVLKENYIGELIFRAFRMRSNHSFCLNLIVVLKNVLCPDGDSNPRDGNKGNTFITEP